MEKTRNRKKAVKSEKSSGIGRSSKSGKNAAAYILLFVIIALQLARIVYIFSVEKTGQHSDEIWGYGLANSYYKPYLFMTNDEQTETYANQWVNSAVFRDYIMTGDGDRFTYASVISNMKVDSHPPLYFLLLHTISSCFPGNYSLWYGFSIGLVCFVILQIFLYKLTRFLTKSNLWALLAAALYGFSIGALDTFVFVRQYGMLTMFAVMSVYFHARLLYSAEKQSFRNNLLKLALVTAGGCLTHYFFIVYAFVLSAGFFFRYLFGKKGGRLLAYSAVMLISVLLTFTISGAGEFIGLGTGADFSGGREGVTSENSSAEAEPELAAEQEVVAEAEPAIAAQAEAGEVSEAEVFRAGLAASVGGLLSDFVNILYNPMFDENVNVVLQCILYDNFGITAEIGLPYWLLHGCFIALLFLLLVVFGAFFVAAKSKDTEGRLYIWSAKLTAWLKKTTDYRFLLFLFVLAALFEHYIVIGYSQPFVMEIHTNRYLFLTYPTILLVFVLAVKKAAAAAGKKREKLRQNAGTKGSIDGEKAARFAAVLLILAVGVCNNVFAECVYLFPRKENTPSLEEVVKDKDVVLALSEHWLMTCYCDILSEAQDVFVTDSGDVYDYEKELTEYDTEEAILIVDAESLKNVAAIRNKCDIDEVNREMLESIYLDFYTEVYEGKTVEYLLEDTIFKRDIYVYRVY